MPSNVGYINKAVSFDDTPKRFFMPVAVPLGQQSREVRTANTTSSLRKRLDNRVVEREVSCEATALDNIVSDAKAAGVQEPVAVWIDVENAIGDVLAGGLSSFKNDIFSVYVEVEELACWSGQRLAADVDKYLSVFKIVRFWFSIIRINLIISCHE